MSVPKAPSPRDLQYRCAVIIAEYKKRLRASLKDDLKIMLGPGQRVEKGQHDRAMGHLGPGGPWPDTCGNTRGIGGLGSHETLSTHPNSGLGSRHFDEPWHLFCKDCNDALTRTRGGEVVRPPAGPYAPVGWKKDQPI